LEKKLFKRHKKENFYVFKSIFTFNRTLQKSRFLRKNDPETINYLKTKFLTDYQKGGLDFLNHIISATYEREDVGLAASLFGGRFRNRFGKKQRERKRISVRSIISNRQRKLLDKYEKDFRCGLESVLSSISVVLMKDGLCRKLVKDSFMELKEYGKLKKQEQERLKLMKMQKCIEVKNIIQSKILILKAVWFRSFESSAKKKLFMKKRSAQPQYIEVNDGQKGYVNYGSAVLAKRPFKKRRNLRNQRRRKKQATVPKNISRMHHIFLGRVFVQIENFIQVKKRKQNKKIMHFLKIWVKRNKHYNPSRFLSVEEKNEKLQKMFIMLKCKMAEKKSFCLFHFYKKFILLRYYGKFGCRSVIKNSKYKLKNALEMLRIHNSEEIDKELKIKYGVINLSKLIFRIKTTFFGLLHEQCKYSLNLG
jgi:hypothetical protein